MAPTGKERISKLLEQLERAVHVFPPSEHNIDASLVCSSAESSALLVACTDHAFTGRG